MLFPAPGAFLLGAAGWTLTEYNLHRFVGHTPRNRQRGAAGESRDGRGASNFLLGDFGDLHRAHHRTPSFFAPTGRKVVTGAAVVGALALGGSLVAGPRRGISFALGYGAMYAAYEVIHRLVHTHPPRGAYLRWAYRHHLYHHFGESKMNHGVTTAIWDKLFGTFVDPETVRVPRKLAPPWLASCDPAAAYAADYELI